MTKMTVTVKSVNGIDAESAQSTYTVNIILSVSDMGGLLMLNTKNHAFNVTRAGKAKMNFLMYSKMFRKYTKK